ncbi:hypothetical protein NIES2100_55560 [Calothrix sp. NIES-2100]|uniref:hypothetical protein n=1 Tax=Calothrix sp. NIES-2100 TaxID=1954172 RepID=UPI000B5E8194|nr:hypothetical protein NIES2100_55560 [Calothrix sp. NIES-2100]
MLPTKTQLLPTIITFSVIGYCVWTMSAFQLRVNSDTTQIFDKQIDAADVKDRVKVENFDCKLSTNKLDKKVVSEVFTLKSCQIQRLLIN